MTYGPFHPVRCKDDIAAALLDGADEKQSLASTRESSDRADGRDAESEAPSFLSNEDPDASVLTGPAASDER